MISTSKNAVIFSQGPVYPYTHTESWILANNGTDDGLLPDNSQPLITGTDVGSSCHSIQESTADGIVYKKSGNVNQITRSFIHEKSSCKALSAKYLPFCCEAANAETVIFTKDHHREKL